MNADLLLEEIRKLKRRLARNENQAQKPLNSISFYSPSISSSFPFSRRFTAPNGAALSVSFTLSCSAQTDITIYVYLDEVALDTSVFHLEPAQSRSYSITKNVRKGGEITITLVGEGVATDASVLITGENVEKFFTFCSLEVVGSGSDKLISCITDNVMSVYKPPLTLTHTLTQNASARLYALPSYTVLARLHPDGKLLLGILGGSEIQAAQNVTSLALAPLGSCLALLYIKEGALKYRLLTQDSPLSPSPEGSIATGLRVLSSIACVVCGATVYLAMQSKGACELFSLTLPDSQPTLTRILSIGLRNIHSTYYSPEQDKLFLYSEDEYGYICESVLDLSSYTLTSPKPLRICSAYARYNESTAYILDEGIVKYISLKQ